MLIRFLTEGESPVPGVGAFSAGDTRDLSVDVATGFMRQGIAEEVKQEKTQPAKAAVKEV